MDSPIIQSLLLSSHACRRRVVCDKLSKVHYTLSLRAECNIAINFRAVDMIHVINDIDIAVMTVMY